MRSAYDYRPIRTTDSKDRIGTVLGSATIESFTLSIYGRTKIHLLAIGHRLEIYRNI